MLPVDKYQRTLHELMRSAISISKQRCNLFWSRQIEFLSRDMQYRIFLIIEAASVCGLTEGIKRDIRQWIVDQQYRMSRRATQMERADHLPSYMGELEELKGWHEFLVPLTARSSDSASVLNHMLKYVAGIGL